MRARKHATERRRSLRTRLWGRLLTVSMISVTYRIEAKGRSECLSGDGQRGQIVLRQSLVAATVFVYAGLADRLVARITLAHYA